MSINKCKIIGVLLLTFCIGFFVNIDGVKAINEHRCEIGQDYSKAVTCDYGNGNSTVVFARYADGSYCSTVEYFKYEYGTLVISVEGLDEDIRGTVDMGISEETIRDTVEYGFCPELKIEHRFPFENVNSTNPADHQFIFYDADGGLVESAACLVSGWFTVASSECQISSGTNYTSISLTKLEEVIEDTEGKRNEVRGPDVGQINDWGMNANYGEQWTTDDIGNSCTIINNNQWLVTILNFIIWALAIAGILVLIIMTILDFTKAVTASDDVGLKKAFQHLVKRAIAVVLLILAPILLSTVINFVNNSVGSEEGTVQIGETGDLYCGVADS